MKKKLGKKFNLNKKTIAALNYDEMNSLRGGVTVADKTCATDVVCCPSGNSFSRNC